MKTVHLNGQVRFIENVSEVGSYILVPRHRFYANWFYNHKLGKLKVENRLRYQHQFADVTKEPG